jgi:hypothetical protein
MAWSDAWDSCGLPRHTRNDLKDALVYSCHGVRGSTSRTGKAIPLVEVMHVETAEQITRYRMRECEFEGVMCTIIATSDWCSGVQRQRQVPSALLRGLLVMKLPLCNAFPGLKPGEQDFFLPHWINLCVNAPRMLHHMQRGGTIDQLRLQDGGTGISTKPMPWDADPVPEKEEKEKEEKEKEEKDDDDDDDMETMAGSDSDEEDRFSDCSSNERNAFYTQASDSKAPQQERSIDMLPERGTEVKFSIFTGTAPRKNHKQDEFEAGVASGVTASMSRSRSVNGLHPYELSALAFALASRAQALLGERDGSAVSEAWHPTRIYHFFEQWLRMSDHVVAPVTGTSEKETKTKALLPVAPEVRGAKRCEYTACDFFARRFADTEYLRLCSCMPLSCSHY